jgi:hypothetical protein
MKPTRHIALLLIVAAIAVVGSRQVAAGMAVDARIDNRLIVELRDGVDPAVYLAQVEVDYPDADLAIVDSVPGRPIHLLALTWTGSVAGLDAFETALETMYGAFTWSAEFLYTNQAPEGRTGSVYVDGIAPDAFADQYARTRLGLDAAHARSRGLSTVVAVLDTGVDSGHPELAQSVLPFGFDFIDDDANPADVGNGVDDDGDGTTDEMVGHGTFVAGLVLLTAPDAKILPVRILDTEGTGDEWLLVRGLYYAIDRGVEVINLSLSSTYDTTAVRQAVAEAARNGIMVVAAAGNLGHDTPREFPAMDEAELRDPAPGEPREITGALGVAAVDDGDVKAPFSNFHRKLSLSAPGAGGLGADPAERIVSAGPKGVYAAWEGTSFATAFVSGTAALIRSQHPAWEADVDTYLLLEAALTGTAANIDAQNPDFAEDDELGAGRLDTAAAVAIGPIAPVVGDLDRSGLVSFSDLSILLADWHLTHSSADLDLNGRVGFSDLVILLNAWGTG